MAVLFVRGENPIWFFNNLVGQVLDDTYYAFFLTNDLPYIPQAVYKDENGISPWSNPIEFSPAGSLPDNLYFDPALVYRIEIRQGPTQADPLIWLIENYVPGNQSSSTIDTILTSDNLITNPQFADISFSSPLTLTTAGTYDIAPGWQLTLVGTGTVSTVITQVTTSGTEDIAGNPAYYLRFQNSGWTSATLFQRFPNNGSLFANGAVGVAFSAFATTNQETLPVYYAQSDSGTTKLIVSAPVLTGAFQQFSGAVNIPISTNTDEGTSGYVDIKFSMPGDSDISLSNVQFTGQATPLPGGDGSISPVYQEIPYSRVVDHEFNIYRNSIILQPKDSVLVGWNFAMNPWQFVPSTGATATANGYTADQTVIVSQAYVDSATGSNVSVKRGSAANNYGLTVTALTAHNQFAIFQYIDAASIAPYWGLKMSALVKAFLTTTHSSSVKVKMRLFYTTSLPAGTSQTVPVASWTEGGDPVFAGGTIPILPRNDPSYTLGSTAEEFAFDAFQMPANAAATQTLGVMVYTVGNMNQNATADFVVFQDVSLAPNDFAIATNPKSFDETLRECQYYFESSYNPFVIAGAVTNPSFIQKNQDTFFDAGGGNWIVRAAPFQFEFNTLKRAAPTIVLLSPVAGTAGNVDVDVYVAGSINNSATVVSTHWTAIYTGVKGIAYEPADATTLVTGVSGAATDSAQGVVYFHFTADSRL